MKKALLAVAVAVIATIAAAGAFSFKPKDGFVPDETTAIAIAIAVWTPIYGRDTIENEKPIKAFLLKGIWHVQGSLPKPMTVGGVAEAQIAKSDGRIVAVSHGK